MAATADPTHNPYKIGHPKKRAFLAAYANSGNIRASCKAAGVVRQTYYDWQEQDDHFSTACGLAKAEYGDALEAELTRQVMSDHNTTALIVALKMARALRGHATERGKQCPHTALYRRSHRRSLSPLPRRLTTAPLVPHGRCSPAVTLSWYWLDRPAPASLARA